MGQSVAGVKDRREAGFKIDHAILAQIFGLLVGDPLQRLFGLHDCDGVGKAFQIFGETAFVGALMKPLRQRCGIAGRKVRVFCFFRQVNDGLRPQHAVEVLMQEHFWQAIQSGFIKFHEGLHLPSSWVPHPNFRCVCEIRMGVFTRASPP